ncbi:MAG: HlyD family efflux transporter periplasmic adaptor subunit [Pseudomonadota bacterium]
MNTSTRLLLAAATLLVAACGSETSTVPTVSAASQDVEFTVPARGELVASEALPVALPPGIRMGFNISWMAPEFSEVSKGDVVARFDDERILETRQDTALAIAKSDFKLAELGRVGALEQVRINHESDRVDGEKTITETYANVDERLMSRNEIIDALSDVEYLNVASAFLEWQWETFDQRTQAEANTIIAEQQGEKAKLDKQDTALGMMELRSPADGTFVYAETPWGEKLGKGKRVFPGMPVGVLPVKGKVRARLYVTESEAIGLAEAQAVRFRLDSAPEQSFTASVVSVSAVATPLDRENPQKFFTVEADIDNIDAELMRVGSQLRAEIITGALEDAIVVPSQAVYGDDSSAWVYVAAGGEPEKRTITLGQRGADLVEIAGGLEPGERIALISPDEAG